MLNTYFIKENIYSIIVAFNPNNSIIDNISSIISFSNKIIIIDNNSDNREYQNLFINTKNILVKNLDRNFGIGYALNQGIKIAIELKAKWIFTFDQDSKPIPSFYDFYKKALLQSKYSNIGLLGCKFSDNINKKYYNIEQIPLLNKKTIITSGTLHNVEIFKKVGLYDEDLFIDCVDFDFSLRVCKSGYKCLIIDKPLLEHMLGNPIIKYGIKSTNHSPLRRYYMTRNTIILAKRYFNKYPIWIIKKILFLIWYILCIILIEKDKKTKMKYIRNGFLDGLKHMTIHNHEKKN